MVGEQTLPTRSAKKLLPWLVAVAFFMEFLDTTILNTAVPAVSEALHVSPLAMKYVLASYTLSLAVFIGVATARSLTIFSTVVFRHLKAGDDSNVTAAKAFHPG